MARTAETHEPAPEDGVWTDASELAGGPRGRFAGRTAGALAWLTHRRVLVLLTALAALLAYAVKQPCFGINWGSPDVFSRACYSDWPVIFTGRGLDDGVFPFITEGARVEYPVLLGLFAGLTAFLTPGGGDSPGRTLFFFEINAVLAAIAWGALVLVTAATAERLRAQGAFRGTAAERPRWGSGLERGAVVALSPAVIATVYINWDVYAVLFAAVALWAVVSRRWALAGVMIGLGTAFKLYPLLLLGVVFLGALRSESPRRDWKGFGITTATAALAWLAVNVPAMVRDFGAWSYFLSFSREREAGFSSVWFVYNLTARARGLPEMSPGAINTAGMALLLAALAGIVVFAWKAPQRVQPAALAFLVVAAFVLTNKVYSPQFVIWLVPLAALAGIPWRWLIAWQVVELLHWWAVWEALAKWSTPGVQSQHAIPDGVYSLAVVAHVAAVLALCAYVVVWEAARPRASGASGIQARP